MDGVVGMKALGVRELTYKLSFLGVFVAPADAKSGLNAQQDVAEEDGPNAALRQFNQEEIAELKTMLDDRLLKNKLVNSIAPHIFGKNSKPLNFFLF